MGGKSVSQSFHSSDALILCLAYLNLSWRPMRKDIDWIPKKAGEKEDTAAKVLVSNEKRKAANTWHLPDLVPVLSCIILYYSDADWAPCRASPWSSELADVRTIQKVYEL